MAGKRLLNFNASDFLSATPMELKQAILASEGRTIMAENVPGSPLLLGATNAEYEAHAGADLLMFNALDLFDPEIACVPEGIEENPISWVKRACGRAIGVNLEPVDDQTEMVETASSFLLGAVSPSKRWSGRMSSASTSSASPAIPARAFRMPRSLIRSGLSKSISTAWSSLAKCMGPVWMSLS